MDVESSFIEVSHSGLAVDVRILTPQIGEREGQIIVNEIAAAAAPGWLVAVDLSQVAFVASAGLGALVGIHNSAKAAEGRLTVYGVAPELLQMLKLTRLDKLLTIKPDREAALKALR
jgi:anti-anti-sigma factor